VEIFLKECDKISAHDAGSHFEWQKQLSFACIYLCVWQTSMQTNTNILHTVRSCAGISRAFHKL